MAPQKTTLNKLKSVPALGGRSSSASFPFSSLLETPIGKIGLITQNGKLSRLHFLFDVEIEQTFIADEDIAIVTQLTHYFRNPAYRFSLPLNIVGTPFQRKVWQSLLSIPIGQTISYGDLAKQLQTGPRAIGQACRTNPTPLIVPCHRVVAQDKIGGFAGAKEGAWIQAKQWLLEHEGALS